MQKGQESNDSLEFAVLLKGIIFSWRDNAQITTEEIARRMEIKDPSALRLFLSEKKALQNYRKGNSLIDAITRYLDEEIAAISSLIGRRRYYQYRMMRSDDSHGFVVYEKRDTLERFSRDSSVGFWKVLNNYFGADAKAMDDQIFPIISGKYYCYRASSYGPQIVKSHMEIKKEDCGFITFNLYHPDRHHRTVDGRHPKPRVTIGVVFNVLDHLYFLGNSGANQGVNYFVLRRPFDYDYSVLMGFTVAPNTGRTVLSAKTLLIKDDNASAENVERITIDDSDSLSNSLGFNVDILKNDSGEWIADTITGMDRKAIW